MYAGQLMLLLSDSTPVWWAGLMITGLFQTAYQEMEGKNGVTIQLDSTFIDGAYVGELVEATGEVVRAGGSLIFVRGQITTGQRTLMTFSGVIRKFDKRA